jgi:hypothetical protein
MCLHRLEPLRPVAILKLKYWWLPVVEGVAVIQVVVAVLEDYFIMVLKLQRHRMEVR